MARTGSGTLRVGVHSRKTIKNKQQEPSWGSSQLKTITVIGFFRQVSGQQKHKQNIFRKPSTGPTWRIIPVSKSLVTLIYKPFTPFGRGTLPYLGDLLTRYYGISYPSRWSSKWNSQPNSQWHPNKTTKTKTWFFTCSEFPSPTNFKSFLA